MRIHKVVASSYGNNAYVVVCKATGESVIIDTPSEAAKVLQEAQGTRIRAILITHNHFDHLEGYEQVKTASRVASSIHFDDADALPSPPDFYLADGDIIPVGSLAIRVIHTPGHTPGATCLFLDGHLFTGDTLFPGGPGRTASPEDLQQELQSITQKLFPLPDETVVYPGHGEDTTIGKAKAEHAIFAGRPHPPDLCGDVQWLES